MSVLTVTGTSIPDPTLSYDYSRSRGPISSRPSHAPTTSVPPPGIFTRPERKSTYAEQATARIPSSSRSPSNHQHSRTISSTILPGPPFDSPSSNPSTRVNNPHSRNPSTSHSRQSSTSNTMSVHRQGTTASSTSVPRRSTSGRSVATNSPTSYVALMRRQKATVWCDRSQNIDPRIAAAQKAAKHRAAMEVAGVTSAGRTSTINSGGVVGKIRHGGVPKAPGYVPVNLTGASVPLRLSANEIGAEEEELSMGENSMVHGRSGSGRSSTNSAKYRSGYPRPDGGRFSTTSTPPSGEGSPGQSIPEQPQTRNSTMAGKHDYLDDEDGKATPAESEDSFGELKDMTGPSSVQQALAQAKKNDDLRRRGSVDERAMSMGSGVRLFVANPDLDN